MAFWGQSDKAKMPALPTLMIDAEPDALAYMTSLGSMRQTTRPETASHMRINESSG
jgi:hypothetical protein